MAGKAEARSANGWKTARATRLLAVAAALVGAALLAPAPSLVPSAQAVPGDVALSVPVPASCFVGSGIAFDGADLWFSCYGSSPDLIKADPLTGAVLGSWSMGPGLGAIAYDAGRNAIWASAGSGGDHNVYLIPLGLSKTPLTTSPVPVFQGAAQPGANLVDGLAYDPIDDSLYYSPDVSTTIYHYTTTGALLGSWTWAGFGHVACANSGLALAGGYLWQASGSCGHFYGALKTAPSAPLYDLGLSSTITGQPEGIACDGQTFLSSGLNVMWAIEAFRHDALAIEVPPGTCGPVPLPRPTCEAQALLVTTYDLVNGRTRVAYADTNATASAYLPGNASATRPGPSPIPNASASSSATYQAVSFGDGTGPVTISASALSSHCEVQALNDSSLGLFVDAYGRGQAQGLHVEVRPPEVPNDATLDLSAVDAALEGRSLPNGSWELDSCAVATSGLTPSLPCSPLGQAVCAPVLCPGSQNLTVESGAVRATVDGYETGALHLHGVFSQDLIVDAWVDHVQVRLRG